MKKTIYSTDTIWYNEGVYNALVALNDKHSNAIAIFGGALRAYDYINSDNPSFDDFVKCLPSVIHSAKFFRWHEGIAGALKTFCRLCLVDPALVEAYIGMTFEQLITK